MSGILPIAFAAYPILLSGVGFAWLLTFPFRSWANWFVRLLACGNIIVFAFMTGPWAFTSYYLRYVVLWLFAVAAVFSYFRARRNSQHFSAGDNRLPMPSILVLLPFLVLNALAIGSNYPAGKTAELAFPLRSGTYYVLQGGNSRITNPFHALSNSKLAVDIVKLNSLGNRAHGIGPRGLGAYEIFGEKLYSPCRGVVFKVRADLPDNPPGHPDTGQPEGNYVVLKCAEADVFMAHLKRGSIKVAEGEVVALGQQLAEIGNSGNTSEPHLHIDAKKDGVEQAIRFNGQSLSINSVVIRK
ncbi:M23 family metallopeptidase [Marinobacter sp. F4206]|uniref:M23 family metallopeptidase n=1 Tax=Marinobacter sp. F4206 TaxID=2861777 RepID=UPI001C5CDB63|nr:M23 family metallopeptidase [Marinobacter sp. F4206]MBW4934976.1 M23 family metallopeptidase [Marinobacter sp. F4206]